MVESAPIITKEQVSLNPTIGDKLKSAVGLGDTVRTATTVKEGAALPVASSVPLNANFTSATFSSGFETATFSSGFETATFAAPVVASNVSATSAAVITEAAVVTTKVHAPVVAEVQTQRNITIEDREVISQNIVKPVIEMHEKHIQRNITEAPVMTQSVNATLVQEIGRENLGFVAPIPTIQTAFVDHGETVQNLKVAPVLAEIHHKPVIERHEQVIIHENLSESLTEIRTQPIVQNIYERPTIIRTSETIIETAPTVLAAPVMAAPVVAAPVIAAPVLTASVVTAPVAVATVPVATTAVLQRSGSASSISSLSSVEDAMEGRESLGSKIKRKLHVSQQSASMSAAPVAVAALPAASYSAPTLTSTAFTEKPKLKDRIKNKILHKNAPF